MKRSLFALALLATIQSTALAEPPIYAWPAGAREGELATRIAPPAGAHRVNVEPSSFADWLRHLPLLAAGAAVHLWNGQLKSRQDVHAAVIDLDVAPRDLQQCADAVMRLRAEFFFTMRPTSPITFHPDAGKPRALVFEGRDRKRFERWLIKLFADAGSASLQAELLPVRARPIEPGDVLIQGGYPGHAVMVLDVAEGARGERFLLLGQSYMPAQQLHVLRNLGAPSLSPWYDAATLATDGGLVTPEWRPFHQNDVRRFP